MGRLCVFDFDGTLADTLGDIAAAVNRALAELGYAPHPLDAYRRMVGSGADTLCERALPDGAKGDAPALLKLYKACYIEHCTERTRPYAGIPEALRALLRADCALAVITNKPHEQLLRIWDAHFKEFPFAALVGQQPGVPKKPQPDSLLTLMDQLGHTKAQTVYIGDSDVDMLFARAAGVAGVGAAWGFRGRGELERAGASYIADDPAGMARCILAPAAI
ncbi:MAG: HAD-IA family hydrolase [Oscillospiraceae bacterium]|nr:HAD-IA family hydrolase [Oscillospiraceae bacterium]